MSADLEETHKTIVELQKDAEDQAAEVRKLKIALDHLERRFEMHTDITHAEPDLREIY